jgi:hypothetical protein
MTNRRCGAALALGALVATAAGCAGEAPRPPARAQVATTAAAGGGSSGSHGATGSLPSTQSGANAPVVSAFTVPPSVPCAAGEGAKVSVPVTYTVTGAMTVTFTVDTQQVVGQPPLSGSYEVSVPCDGNAHTIVLFAVATDTSTTTQSKATMAGG